MKRNLFPLLAFLILLFPACEKKINVDKEKQAIITALNEESAAYVAMDSTKWMSYWVQDKSTRRVDAGEESYSVQNWKQLYENMKANLANDTLMKDYSDIKFTKSDYNIKVYPECAWAYFNEKLNYTYKGEPVETEGMQLRILEKADGQWKIAFLGNINVSSYKDEEEEAEEPDED